MYQLRRILGKFWILIVIGIMLTIFLTIATSKKELDVYTKENATYTQESESEEKEDIKTVQYQNKDISFTMAVPEDWNYVLKDGYDTYVHNASASSVQIQVLNYYPRVNVADQTSIASALAGQDIEMTEFSKVSGNCYQTVGQKYGNAGVTDYIQEVIWDRQHVVKVIFTFSDENYEKLKDTIMYCLDSISWQYEDPIGEKYFLQYQEAGDFEYAIPTGWITGTADTGTYAYEESTGAMLTVNVIEDASSINEISELEYSEFLSNGRSGFVLTKFEQSDEHIYGEATYSADTGSISVIQYYTANGTYHYILTYEFPTGNTDYITLAQDALKMTRIFMESTEPETETEKAPILTETPDLYEKYEEGQDNDISVSSLADALVQLGFPEDKASTAADILSNFVPAATYAEIASSSESAITVLIQDSQQNNFYLVAAPDGTPQSVFYGSLYGECIWKH